MRSPRRSKGKTLALVMMVPMEPSILLILEVITFRERCMLRCCCGTRVTKIDVCFIFISMFTKADVAWNFSCIFAGKWGIFLMQYFHLCQLQICRILSVYSCLLF